MPELTTRNHYIPQAYLRGWSADGQRVWSYRTLVPASSYPIWELRSLRGVAFRTHLYTSVASGAESDEFERWLNQQYEAPAAEALRKVRAEEPVAGEDLDRLVLYAASLDLRTPASYSEQRALWERELPPLLDQTLEETVNRIEQAAREGRPMPDVPNRDAQIDAIIKAHIIENDGTDSAAVRLEATLGREMWLWSMREIMQTSAPLLLAHRWGFLRPAVGCRWYTSDTPVMRLNHFSDENYSFGGGWGKPGSEFLLPLSPTRLLYTKVGHDVDTEFQLSSDLTLKIQKLLAERAHRWIFAVDTPQRPTFFRPREIDREKFIAEEAAWEAFHREHSAAHGYDVEEDE